MYCSIFAYSAEKIKVSPCPSKSAEHGKEKDAFIAGSENKNSLKMT
jgi:hypothetical protein